MMNDNEKKVSKKLIVSRLWRWVISTSNGTSIADKLANRKRLCVKGGPKYRNCTFILGYAAEVERLWFICKYDLTDNRKRTTPMLFEAFVFED